MNTFYKIDSTRFSFQEYWWGTPSPLVIFGWLAKVLGIRVPGSMDDPAVESLTPHEVSYEALPEQVTSKFNALTTEFVACGFHSPIFHAINDRFHNTSIYWASFSHSSGQAFARIHHRIWSTPHPPRTYLFPMFITAFTDGSFLVSSAGKPDSAAPRAVRTNRKIGAAASALWASHQQELEKELNAKAVHPVQDADQLRSVMGQYHVTLRNFHLGRKAFRPLTPAEEKQTVAMEQMVRACEAGGLQHAEVLAEMEKLQQRKTGWGNGILLLLVSMLIFVGAGSAQWSWKVAVALIPILLFHEFGHYVAMRAFKYRNLRMFFIPLFGAAVSGQNYNVPGWKKAIVSLMGPVPGIILGAIVGCAGLILHKTILVKVALLALILNGFNLLPVLPLDGGWVMHAALFARHHVLDTAFRALAGIALLVGGFFGKDRILMFLGVFMLIGTHVSYKMARIAAGLRRRGLAAASPDDQNIPPETAQTIITELKFAFPKGLTNKSIAQHALNIFESLNARPPGWFATIALLSAHGISFLMALVFGSFFVLGEHGNLGGALNMAAQLPRHKLACGSVLGQGSSPIGASGDRNTIIGLFRSEADARKAFDSVKSQVGGNVALKLFGHALMLSLPADDDTIRKTWLTRIQGHTTNAFVDSTNFHAGFRFACIAPNQNMAKSIEEEAAEYFAAAREMQLVPPWTASEKRSLAEREQHRLARHTYAKLQETKAHYKEPAIIALQKSVARARRQGDLAEEKRLREEEKRVVDEFTKKQQQGVRQESGVDIQLVDMYMALPTASYPNYTNSEYKDALQKLASRMGQLPLEGDQPKALDARYSTHWGTVSREGLIISFPFLSFQNIFDGAPALADWLCSKGCIDLKYAFESAFSLLEGE